MDHTTRILSLGLVILLGGATYGMAQGGPKMSFEQLDTDGNGMITRAEAETRQAERFAAADTDGSGTLSLEELAAQAATRAQDRAGRMMSRLDANGDGVLSAQEMAERGGRRDMFARADQDADGAVSRAEFDAMRAERAQKHADRAKN